MQNFKLNEQDLLSNQDWTFPTFTAYGPGRFKEIGKFCKNFKILTKCVKINILIQIFDICSLIYHILSGSNCRAISLVVFC